MPLNYDSLESQYAEFRAPDAEIKIEGSIINREMAIEWVEVEQTIEPQADTVRFAIVNAFVIQETKMQWIGSKIAVGKALTLAMGYADKKKEVFDGLITGYTLEYPEDSSPRIVVTAMDRSMLLMRSAHSKVWKTMKDSDVVRQIAGEYGLTAELDDTSLQKPMIEQAGLSDYHFIRTLAAANDYHFYVTGKKLYFKKPQTGSPLIELRYGKHLTRFALHVDASGQVSQVKVRGYDVKTMQAVEGTASSVTAMGGKSRTGPSLAQSLSSKKVEIVYTQAASQAEAQALAKAMLERQARELVNGQGVCTGIPDIRAGATIRITGLGGEALDQTLRLTRVTHRLDAQSGYTTEFEGEANAI